MPDWTGQVIPASASGGQFSWGVWGSDPSARLIARNEVVSASRQVSSSFSCGTCCPPSMIGSRIEPSSFDLEIDASQNIEAIETDQDCYGTQTDIRITFPDWEEEVPGICRVEYDSGLDVNQLIGTNAGSTNLRARWTASRWKIVIDDDSPCEEEMVVANPLAFVEVRPVLQGIDPQRRLIGTTGNVNLGGRGFGNNPVVNVSGGITASVQSASDTLITVNFVIVGSATPGNHGVTVTAGGRTSNSINFFVQIPSSFNAVSAMATDLGCGSTAAGYGAAVTYQVMDQEGIAITSAGMTPQETVSTPVGGFTDFRPFATPPTTNSAGRFLDTPVGTCFGPPIPSGNICLSPVIQRFNIRVPTPSGEATYPIPTETRRIDCKNGIRIDVVNGTVVQSVTLGSID